MTKVHYNIINHMNCELLDITHVINCDSHVEFVSDRLKSPLTYYEIHNVYKDNILSRYKVYDIAYTERVLCTCDNKENHFSKVYEDINTQIVKEEIFKIIPIVVLLGFFLTF